MGKFSYNLISSGGLDMNAGSGRTLWAQVKARLAANLAELSEEVRAYPSPIARCDDQLPGLLERRAEAQRRWHLAESRNVEGFDDARFASLIDEFTSDEERSGA